MREDEKQLMISKNNKTMIAQRNDVMRGGKQKFALRKLSIGVASVFIRNNLYDWSW